MVVDVLRIYHTYPQAVANGPVGQFSRSTITQRKNKIPFYKKTSNKQKY